MAENNTIYLVTGANRGIGRGLVEAFLSRPNTTVIAGVRDLENDSSQSLKSLQAASGSKIITVKIDSNSEDDPGAAVDYLKTSGTHSIDHVDCVIANAGICTDYSKAIEASAEAMKEHFAVNTVGPLLLFQATQPLLQAAKQPQFVVISSGVGSISQLDTMRQSLTAYGASKAALNYVTRKIHLENEDLIAFALAPGFVQTDMGNRGARMVGMERAFMKLEDSIPGLVNVIDGASREHTSGKFFRYDGSTLLW